MKGNTNEGKGRKRKEGKGWEGNELEERGGVGYNKSSTNNRRKKKPVTKNTKKECK